jgi:hypothetical protein
MRVQNEAVDYLTPEKRERLAQHPLLSRRERRALKYQHRRQGVAALAGGVVTAERFRKQMK